jgi:hypothetical protein
MPRTAATSGGRSRQRRCIQSHSSG